MHVWNLNLSLPPLLKHDNDHPTHDKKARGVYNGKDQKGQEHY